MIHLLPDIGHRRIAAVLGLKNKSIRVLVHTLERGFVADAYGRDFAAFNVRLLADIHNVPVVDATATMDDDGNVTIFAVNRDMAEDVLLTCDLRAFGDLKAAEHIVLHHDDVKAVNTEENPENVAPSAGSGGRMDGGRLEICLRNLSWNVIRLAKA